MKDENDIMHPHAQPTLALDLLAPSRTNPRSRRGFDDASLNELAASIKSAGVLQPILVRPLPAQAVKPVATWPFPTPSYAKDKEETKPAASAQYEIIAGERRWRASRIAGLADVPVLIRELTDLEVLRIQLIENVQRKDLDALEEAEGYEKLMQQKDAEGNPYTAELIGNLMGVSKATVYARLKLLALCQDARNAFFDGKIDASTALLIARIPVEKLQLQALKKVTEECGCGNSFMATGDKMSFRKAREILQQEFMLDLDRAPFDPKDSSLLPKAGSCQACPNRTGNAPDLFDDVKSKNVCTDTNCFALKKTAYVLKLQKEAESSGAEFVKGKEAKKLIPNQYYDVKTQLKDNGYVTLDTLVPGDDKKRTIGQLLEENKMIFQGKVPPDMGNIAVQKTVVANPHREGQLIETVNIEAATKALREAGFEITLKGKDNSAQIKQDQDKQAAKEKAKLELENKFRARLFDTLHQQIEADMLDPNSKTFPMLYRRVAVELFSEYQYNLDHEDLVALMRKYATLPVEQEGEEIDWESHVTEFEDNLPNLTPAQHLMFIIEIALIASELTAAQYSGPAKTMLALAEDLGIDADGMYKEVTAEAKAAEKAAKKPAAKKASAPAETPSTPTQAAQAPGSGAPEKTKAAPAKAKGTSKGKAKKVAAAAAE